MKLLVTLFVLIATTSSDAEINKNQQSFLGTQVHTIQAASSFGADDFGDAISRSGNRLLVGSPLARTSMNANAPGLAYIYDYDGTNWQQSAILQASDSSGRSYFANSVSLDGDRAVVGSYIKSLDGITWSGAVYVFELISEVWTETAKFRAADAVSFDKFGHRVLLSGNKLFVTAIGARKDALDSVGAVYEYDYDGTNWIFTSKLQPSTALEFLSFGNKLQWINNELYVGAYGYGLNRGAVYIYEKQAGNWQQLDKIQPADTEKADVFAVDFKVVGNQMVVSAPKDSELSQNLIENGSIYVFERNQNIWQQVAKLQANDAQASDTFGIAVNMTADTIYVGAQDDDDNGVSSGSVYVYTKSNNIWSQSSKFLAPNATAGTGFGNALLINNGEIIVAAKGDQKGAVYVFYP